MLPALLVTLATAPAAPVPRDTLPNLDGPAPRIAGVRADPTGVVAVQAILFTEQKVQQAVVVNENGRNVVRQQEVEQIVPQHVRRPLADFAGKLVTADGLPLTVEDAARRLKDGATLLVSADGRPVSPGWLKAVAADTVVLLAEGFQSAQFEFGHSHLPKTPAPRLVLLMPDEDGVVRVPVVSAAPHGAVPPLTPPVWKGQAPPAVAGRLFQQVEIQVKGSADVAGGSAAASPRKPLGEVKFEAFDVAGNRVPRAEALGRLKAGGLVLIAGDNRLPDPLYLQAFRPELLVLVSAEWSFPLNRPNPWDYPPSHVPTTPRPAVAPVPPSPPAVPFPEAPQRAPGALPVRPVVPRMAG